MVGSKPSAERVICVVSRPYILPAKYYYYPRVKTPRDPRLWVTVAPTTIIAWFYGCIFGKLQNAGHVTVTHDTKIYSL